MPPSGVPVDIVGEADVVQDDRTGKWVAQCPRCDEVLRRMTAAGVIEALGRHLNERHRETAH